MLETLLGSRIRLEYDDQNESFARYLPVEGIVSRRCIAASGQEDWLLVELDDPIDYQDEVGPELQKAMVPRVLIRSRWASVQIGCGASPSVFLRLVRDSQEVSAQGLVVDDFVHACWARCHLLPTD